ncbi:MAG TPA: carboxypeptidase-like regulatory domain-containing protein, partial [Terriglobia bacterium]|nr:carboxypeptidase-like regulatory domain-containing protein [Terriglobia bacterium]
MRGRRFLPTILSVLALILSSVTASAQTTGTLRGTVKDPSGAVIPGAQITAILEGTNLPRTAPAGPNGDYEFPVLPVGRYDMEVEAGGFKKYAEKGIDVTLGHVVIIDPVMQLGAVTEEITTTAAAPLVETTSTQLGAVMNSRAVTDLPLNARDTYQLLQLQPGVQSQIGSGLFYGSDN